MKRSQSRVLLSFITFLMYPTVAHAQAWSGIINSTRAIDWTGAGIPGGLPDGSWPICQTISAYSGTAAAINSALSNCHAAHPSGGVVVLGSGTFSLSSGISFPTNTTGKLALRGQGANSTKLVFSSNSGACAFICSSSSDTPFMGAGGTPSTANWTAGYAQGMTQITLSSVAGIVAGQTVLILNQCDTGFSGANCATGSAADNNGYFICDTPWTSTGIGCNIANESADGPGWRCNTSPCGPAWQRENVLVTAINGNVVTISHPLHHPNWNASQSPQAIIAQPQPNIGVENLTIDASAFTGTSSAPGPTGVSYQNCYQCWVSGVAIINAGSHSIGSVLATRNLMKDSYTFGNPVGYGDNAGFYLKGGADNVIQNNICHQNHICLLNDGDDEGDVFAYNFSVGQLNPNENMGFATVAHGGSGNNFQLFEGNAVLRMIDDADHGGHVNQTRFRNFVWGWDSCANGQCGTATQKNFAVAAYTAGYGTRYSAHIGNVLGTPGLSTVYRSSNPPYAAGTIYAVGLGYGPQPADPLSSSTVLFWGNYDTVTGAVRWCGNSSDTGWTTICASTSEVPTAAPSYPNAIPTLGDTNAGMGPLPASFYLSSKPSWFGSATWPPIGPDVNNGNVGQCAGTLNVPGKFNGLAAIYASQCAGSGLNTAWGGHVSAIPAMACYFSMGGLPDGTGSVLAFNASACYGVSSSAPNPPPPPNPKPNPPTNLGVIVN